MGIKKMRPTSPGMRFASFPDFTDITKKEPEKSLLLPLGKSGGRNSKGRITVRHKGGGHKRHYRIIDFKRDKDDIPARVVGIEYDPNRSARIALLSYVDGEKRYIIASNGVNVGDILMSGSKAEIRPGNTLPLMNIPVGTFIHNIEVKIGKGGQIARSAGVTAQLLAKEGQFAHIRMPSSEVRLVDLRCRATIGQVGNADHSNISIGKAGRSRHLGIRPTVRGVAMNPIDHPHGGGEGKTGTGGTPVTPWGKPTKGYKTRKHKKHSNKLIVKKRK